MKIQRNPSFRSTVRAAGFALACALLVATAGGCNAVYFYETEKFALNIEARPDPTAPVSGTIGVRQRIVAIVPSKEPGTKQSREIRDRAADLEREAAQERYEARQLEIHSTTPSNGAENAKSPDVEAKLARARALSKASLEQTVEAGTVESRANALSVLSSFRLHKLPVKKGGIVSQITIDNALITGNAARMVSESGRMAQAIGALSGKMPDEVEAVQLAVFSTIFDAVTALKNRGNADANDVLDSLNQLATDLPFENPSALYELKAAPAVLHEMQSKGSRLDRATFDDVVAYVGHLLTTKEILERAIGELSAGRTVTIDTETYGMTPQRKEVGALLLRLRLKETEDAMAAMRKTLGGHPSLRAAMRMVMGIGDKP